MVFTNLTGCITNRSGVRGASAVGMRMGWGKEFTSNQLQIVFGDENKKASRDAGKHRTGNSEATNSTAENTETETQRMNPGVDRNLQS